MKKWIVALAVSGAIAATYVYLRRKANQAMDALTDTEDDGDVADFWLNHERGSDTSSAGHVNTVSQPGSGSGSSGSGTGFPPSSDAGVKGEGDIDS